MKVRNCINLKSKFVTDKIRGADILKYISLTLYTVVEFDTRTRHRLNYEAHADDPVWRVHPTWIRQYLPQVNLQR